jgi:integrase
MRTAIERFVTFAGEDFAVVRVSRHLIRDWMQSMAAERLTRPYINESMRKVKRWLRWAADKGHAPMSLAAELQLVQPLKIGRTKAREPGQRTPATMAQIAQAIARCEGVCRDVTKLCQLTASRPGEILSLTSSEIIITDRGCWIEKRHHKTAYKARARIIPLTAPALAILERYYRPLVPDLYLFPSRKPGEHLTSGALRKALHQACREAGLPIINPYDLRRRGARVARQTIGLDSAQALLGHANVTTTERYAPADLTTSETFGAAMAGASALLETSEFIRPRLSPVTPPPWPSLTDVSRGVRNVAPPGERA